MWSALVIAVRFLTIIPVPRQFVSEPVTDQQQSLSLLFYPLVGLIIGICLLAMYTLTSQFSPLLQALFIVIVWVVITGALHLDGVADSADAWLGGHGDRERTLSILRDTHVGVAAVIALVLTLLLKILAVTELQQLKLAAVILAPVIGRTMALLLFNTTRYVREQGMGTSLTASLPKQRIYLLLLIILLVVIAVLRMDGFVMLFCVLAGFLLLRYFMLQRLGGTTGDTAGALVEFSEILVLIGFILAEKLL